MSTNQTFGLPQPATRPRAQYAASALTEFGRVQDLTSQASGSGAGKFGNGQESSNSWQVRP